MVYRIQRQRPGHGWATIEQGIRYGMHACEWAAEESMRYGQPTRVINDATGAVVDAFDGPVAAYPATR